MADDPNLDSVCVVSVRELAVVLPVIILEPEAAIDSDVNSRDIFVVPDNSAETPLELGLDSFESLSCLSLNPTPSASDAFSRNRSRVNEDAATTRSAPSSPAPSFPWRSAFVCNATWMTGSATVVMTWTLTYKIQPEGQVQQPSFQFNRPEAHPQVHQAATFSDSSQSSWGHSQNLETCPCLAPPSFREVRWRKCLERQDVAA